MVTPGGLGERLGRRRRWRVNLQAKHPLRPLHAEVVDGAGMEGRHRLLVIKQLPPHPGGVPVQGDLDVGTAGEVVAPGASVSAYRPPSSR